MPVDFTAVDAPSPTDVCFSCGGAQDLVVQPPGFLFPVGSCNACLVQAVTDKYGRDPTDPAQDPYVKQEGA